MTWTGFDGAHAYAPSDFAAHVAATRWTDWKPRGITLHNTSAPRLDQWAESGPSHDARLRNLQSYYETQLGWHHGPHLFISRNFINGFSDLTAPGVHSRCFNATHIGIEMVGDYNAEEFDTGDGALVRDSAVFAMATLYRALGLDPGDLVFHKECAIDNHDCPGRKVVKADVIARVKAAMGYPAPVLSAPLPAPAMPPAKPAPWDGRTWPSLKPGGTPKLAWVQESLNVLIGAGIPEDGLDGPRTNLMVRNYQRLHQLTVDGVAGDLETIPSLKAARAAQSGA